MWSYDSKNEFWYRRVTSGFVTLIFTIKEENGQFALNFIGNQSSSSQYHCNTIEQEYRNVKCGNKNLDLRIVCEYDWETDPPDVEMNMICLIGIDIWIRL